MREGTDMGSAKELIAPCGINCGTCIAYQREKNRCCGCEAKTIAEGNSIPFEILIHRWEYKRRGMISYASPLIIWSRRPDRERHCVCRYSEIVRCAPGYISCLKWRNIRIDRHRCKTSVLYFVCSRFESGCWMLKRFIFMKIKHNRLGPYGTNHKSRACDEDHHQDNKTIKVQEHDRR